MGYQSRRPILLDRFADRAVINRIASTRQRSFSPMNLWRHISGWFGRLIRMAGHGSEFLCDTCRYDHGSACRRPERPNARRCPDYRRN